MTSLITNNAFEILGLCVMLKLELQRSSRICVEICYETEGTVMGYLIARGTRQTPAIFKEKVQASDAMAGKSGPCLDNAMEISGSYDGTWV